MGATMRTDELRWNAMGLTAEEILEHVRALPPRERLKLAHDPRFMELRAAVLEFLYEKQLRRVA